MNGVSDIRRIDPTTRVQIPIALERVQAGFPSPAQDYIEKAVDLNEHLIKNENSTFIMKVDSLSMLKIGIDINDELIIDRSIEAKHRDIVVAVLDNQLTVKRLMIEKDRCWLKAENEEYSDIDPKKYDSFEIWGVVTKVIKSFK
ncbi:translesion error-prone DNA polymerase V autoproteolytic subunit [Acinetobacter sp. ANC 5380]|uniref:Translesion error-prone DNA polymerase V autoproteolytic subunit n=2 Tax=Acinetobacter terrae TaxID=2731247 RepID=A0A7Y2RCZ9_9GAMM|nr:translesion error-prone DNA polymerase V autoproteolytic subunit [Acinetobacter terrae]